MKLKLEKIIFNNLLLKLIFLNNLFYSMLSIKIGFNPYIKKLNSGRYCLISSEKITFFNESLTSNSNDYYFNSEIYPNDYSYTINIEQFSKEDGEYIIIFFYKYLFLFSKNETFILNKKINFTEPINKHSIVVPYGHSNNEYYFSIIYINNTSLIFKKGIFNSRSKDISFFNPIYQRQNFSSLKTSSFSCKLMKYNKTNIINCIYGNSYKVEVTNFNPFNDFKVIENLPILYYENNFGYLSYFKSLILPSKEESLVCMFNSSNYYLYCGIYDILTSTFTKYKDFYFNYFPYYANMIFIEYFNETNKILIGINDYGRTMNIYQCSVELKCEDLKKNVITLYYSSVYPNIVLPKNKNNYYVLVKNYDNNNFISSDYLFILNNLTFNSTKELTCEYYFNYEHTKCIQKIPDGFYCNDTRSKTIDKCHDNCKTCEKGPTNDNNNCLTCIQDSKNKYYDEGNCVSNCNNIFYNYNSTLMCKCKTNSNCSLCTQKSLELNLCISCNNDLGYYKKLYEYSSSDEFIKCYKDLEGYYLNNDRKTFYPCYETCKNCSEEGDLFNHKCTQCYDGYELKNDFENISNCYEKCSYFYYYQNNEYFFCTQDENCPKNYSKLISEKGRCIDKCSNDNIYKYEYKNKCYEQCPQGTKDLGKNKTCIGELICNNSYYNYNRTECLEYIPIGYYCNDTKLKTINKCHEKCESCLFGPTNNSTNCLKCKNSSLFLDFGNCVQKCSNGYILDEYVRVCKCSRDIKCEICNEESSLLGQCITCNNQEGYYSKYNDNKNIFPGFVNCYNNKTISDGYYLNNSLDLYMPCFHSCNKCSFYGDEKNNNCDECKIGYYINKNISNNSNCYEKCDNYYYFDSSNKYHCTESNKCPENYKLIRSEKKCIDNCNKDIKYSYEYLNECYSNCPNNTESNKNNICILNNNNLSYQLECPEEYPYENIYEKECIKECNITYLLNNICKINNPIAKQAIADNIRYSIANGKINDILTYITKNGEDLIINEKDIKYQITTTQNQNNNNNNISTIILGECENILKEKYKINSNEPLLIFKMDISVEGLSSSVVEYEIYHPITKQPLNLNYCKNSHIQILLPVSINENEIDKYNPSSDYYNDICYPSTSESGTDIILKDRQKEYVNNNLSLCESGCTFSRYDSNTKKAICICNIKLKITDIKNLKIDKNVFFDGFKNFKNLINISVLKCYKLLFTKKGFLYNIANYILIPIIIYNIISSIVFYLKGYDLLKNQIKKLIEQLKEYENNNKISNENIIDKNIEIYAKKVEETQKPEESKQIKTHKVIKKKKKIKKKIKHNVNNINIMNNIQNENINFPPIRKTKNNISQENRSKFKNNNIDASGGLKSSDTKRNLDKNSTNLKIKDKNFNENLILKDIILPEEKEQKEQKEQKIVKPAEFYNDTELNSLSYKEALIIDKRNYFQYYLSLIKKKQILIFTFYITNDYNSIIIKICLFFFVFVLYFFVNALFFNDSTMHKIYEDKGVFKFIYHLPKIIYSTIISSIISIIVKPFSLSEKNILAIKKEENIGNSENKLTRLLKCLSIKFILYFIISLFFLILFWYYLACFCAVYRNTQYYLIKDTLISFALSMLYPFGLNLLPGIFRMNSLKNNDREIMYKISLIIQLI